MTTLTDQAAVRNALGAWLQAFEARDLDALIDLYAEDSLYANAASPLMRGSAEIKPWFAGAFEAVDGRMEVLEEACSVHGDTALLIGKYFLRPNSRPPQAGDAGRVALVFKRHADGTWKILFDMDNTPPDATPAAFEAEGV